MTASGYTTELARSRKKEKKNYLRQAQSQLQREPQSTHREHTEHRKLFLVSSYRSPSWLREVPNVLQTGRNRFLGWGYCQCCKRHVEQLTE